MGCINCDGDQICWECDSQYRSAHKAMMRVASAIGRFGIVLSDPNFAKVADENQELIPTLHPKLVELLKLISSIAVHDEWNALAPWNRERR